MEALAIVNARAGALSAPQELEQLGRDIAVALPGVRLMVTTADTDVTEEARRAVREGCRLVLAAGGDGTMNAVAAALAGTPAALAILPLGTLNHFARDLGIPLAAETALQVAAQRHVVRVDLGSVNGRVFINNSGLGLYPGIVRLREQREQANPARRWKRPKRLLLLAWATAKVLARYRLLHFYMESDGRRLERTTPVVFVGNNEYAMEGLHAGTRARLDGGRLHVVIARQQRAVPLLWSALRGVLGFHQRETDFERFETSELRIDSHHRQLDVTLDGELVRLATPLRYRLLPGALRVVVPPND